jgi:Arc/MetJ-type ribon-helix-helix transcriptional regulator
MRNIINISVPVSMKKEMEAYAKDEQYASVSEFVRDMWRDYKRKKLLEDIRASQKEFREGKGKILQSFKDLR